jgi:hypothetical protein
VFSLTVLTADEKRSAGLTQVGRKFGIFSGSFSVNSSFFPDRHPMLKDMELWTAIGKYNLTDFRFLHMSDPNVS